MPTTTEILQYTRQRVVRELLNSEILPKRDKDRLRLAFLAAGEESFQPGHLAQVTVPCSGEHDMTVIRAAALIFTPHHPQWGGGGMATVMVPSEQEPLAGLVMECLVQVWRSRSRATLASLMESFLFQSGLH